MAKKQKTELEKLGTEVEFTSRELSPIEDEKKLLGKIGEMRTPSGQEYVGSVVVHYYLDSRAVLQSRYEISNITHISFVKNISENLAALGMNSAVIAIRKHFNPEFKHKTMNAKDKRDDIIKG